MKKKLSVIVSVLLIFREICFSALASTVYWEARAGATASMVNGGGFDIANIVMTDLTTTAGTDVDPVVSSLTYSFVAGDVGAWVYISGGTNWIPGWYQISSVLAGNATLDASNGSCVQLRNGKFVPGYTNGVATVTNPTGGNFGVDYSQQNSAVITNTDGSAAGGTTFTSAGSTFRQSLVGNLIHLTASTGLTVGWYEIVSYSDANNIVLDRSPGTGTLTTFYIGGALSFNSTLDDDWAEQNTIGNTTYFKSGQDFSLGELLLVSLTPDTTNNIKWEGYKNARGDAPTSDNRPNVNMAANNISLSGSYTIKNMMFTGTASTVFSHGVDGLVENCKFVSASSLLRTAFSQNSGGSAINSEFISQNGNAIIPGVVGFVHGCYIHDSLIGMLLSGSNSAAISFNIIERTKEAGFSTSSLLLRTRFLNNTFYGNYSVNIGTGIYASGIRTGSMILENNIFYGYDKAIYINNTIQNSLVENYNDFYRNSTDRINIATGTNSIGVDPGFVDMTEIYGTTATTSGSVLTQNNYNDFTSVEDGHDYVRVMGGTGVTAGNYLIVSHSSYTLTVNNALGTSSAGNVTYVIGTGHNPSIGTNLKAAGFPGLFSTTYTVTGYLDIGAVQRQEQTSSGGQKHYIHIGN